MNKLGKISGRRSFFAIWGLILAGLWLVITILAIPTFFKISNALLKSGQEAVSTITSIFKITDETLTTISDSMLEMHTSTHDLSSNINNFSPLLKDSSHLFGDNFVTIANESKVALETASSGSIFIDNTLKFLSKIPLIGIDYAPEIPLSASLQSIADQISEVPPVLGQIEENLIQSSKDIKGLSEDISHLSHQLFSIQTHIQDIQIYINGLSLDLAEIYALIVSISSQYKLWLSVVFTLILSSELWWLLNQIDGLHNLPDKIKSGTIPDENRAGK